MAMALHCHLALLKTKENNGNMKNTAMEVQLRNKNNRIVLLL